MVRNLLTAFFLIWTSFSFAQNLVPNPGFEAYDYLPNSMMDSGREYESCVKSWTTPNNASTDLISPRMESSHLPDIKPHGGKNASAILVNGDFWAEYVGVKLKEPIKKGSTYYVEFWISTPVTYGKKKINPIPMNNYFGILFDRWLYKKENTIYQGKPHVAANSNIYIKPNEWTKVFGTFTATADAKYLYLGQWEAEGENPPISKGYFIIDDILVEHHRDDSQEYVPGKSYKIEGSIASIDMNNIYFETDKYELLPESFNELNKLARILGSDPSLTIEVHGHTDDEGAEDYNQVLSENRAKAVSEYLVAQGIAKERLKTKGFGKTKPKAANTSTDGRQENRRVELLVKNNSKFTGTPRHELNPDETYVFTNKIQNMPEHQMAFIGKYVKDWSCNKSATATKGNGSALKGYRPTNAKTYILDRAKKEQAIFLNESTLNPQHRAFAISLLEDLQKQGYTYLGVEALNYTDKDLNERQYPTLANGYYTDEPVMGDLIRQAIAMGFEVFPYDATPEQQNKALNIVKKKKPFNLLDANTQKSVAKEWAQAMNINKVFAKNREAKVLVFCSQNHIYESNISGQKFMAQWFQDFSKINPLTIDQVMMSETCKTEEDPVYASQKMTKPVVYLKDKKVFVTKISNQAICDIQVFLPRTTYANYRPTWLQLDGKRQTFFINPDKHGMSYPCIVQAYLVDEDPDVAIPIDVIELPDNSTPIALLLPKGDVKLVMRDGGKSKMLDVSVP